MGRSHVNPYWTGALRNNEGRAGVVSRRRGQVLRYCRTASGMNTTRIPIVQASDCQSQWWTGPPWVSARTALTVTLTGWTFAMAGTPPANNYTRSLHDALPIYQRRPRGPGC